jgi:hypothetical protein
MASKELSVHITLRIAVALLALVALLSSVAFLLGLPPPMPDAPPGPEWHSSHVHQFAEHPWASKLHVVLGVCWVLILPFQLFAKLRGRRPALHRVMGKIAVACGYYFGISALWLAGVMPFAGVAESIVIAFVGGTFLFALTKAYLAARQRAIPAHQRWMLRATAIGLSIATTRVVDGAVLYPSHVMSDQAAFTTSFLVAWVINVTVVELWLRRGRQRRVEVSSA